MPPHLKQSINQANLESGTYDRNVKHLEREMELHGVEADVPLIKTQTSITKKERNAEKTNKKQNEKAKTQTKKQYQTKLSKMINAVTAKGQVT